MLTWSGHRLSALRSAASALLMASRGAATASSSCRYRTRSFTGSGSSGSSPLTPKVPPVKAPQDRAGNQGRPVTQPDGDDGVSPDEPDADESELIGGIDDLGAADLGPIAPNVHDPDADSGRPRK
jgi:hypothetical protein